MVDAQRSGTITLLFTDIVGSTELMERLGDDAAVSVTMKITSLLREALNAHRGDEIKSFGDGLMVAFASTLDAVDCAVAMQRAIAAHDTELDEARHLEMRIGVHVGEPIRVGGDLFGTPVVTASRLCRSAAGRQIVVSDAVRSVCGSRAPYVFRDLGLRRFAGVHASVHAWEVVWNGQDGSTTGAGTPATAPPAIERPHETVVILFADVVASTELTEALGDSAFRERTRELDGSLREMIRRHRGRPVEGKVMGDGVLAVFPSARDALLCALACGPIGDTVGLQLHLGIHAGDVIRDGDNIYGGAVNIASRIADCTQPGEILVSETIRGLARTSAGVTFEDRGDHALKGLGEPQRLYTVRASGLPDHA